MDLDDATLGEFSDDVSVDDALEVHARLEGPLYSHGYSLRVVLLLPRDAALEVLAHVDWVPDSKDWRYAKLKHCRRWTVRGSTFITLRKPMNKGLPMAQLNAAWGTNLYSLIVEDDGRAIALMFHGVRRTDVEKILRERMGLSNADYHMCHYTALERYFVLPAHEARRLAEVIGGEATSGRGPASRKQYLIRDYKVPMIVGQRARRTAKLTIYRLRAGATAQYKVELRLKGRTRDRTQFSEDDIPKLDAVLEQLMDDHDLVPISKPARWEPVMATSWRRDGRLAIMGQCAYRGRAVAEERVRVARACHTPELVFCAHSSSGSLTSVPQEYIRESSLTRREARPTRRRSTLGSAWRALAEDIGRFEGYLSEVILDPQQDPCGFVEAVIETHGEGVGVCALASTVGDVWGSISRLAVQHPIDRAETTLVLLLDFSIVEAVESAMLYSTGDSMTDLHRGPLYPAYWREEWGRTPPWDKGIAALMTPLFQELRERAEASGQRVVTVTTDFRPDHGRGPLLRTHLFRDGRVRSHVGDAGRHYAHMRYLVDSDENGKATKVTMAKDEGEGLPGRIIWG